MLTCHNVYFVWSILKPSKTTKKQINHCEWLAQCLMIRQPEASFDRYVNSLCLVQQQLTQLWHVQWDKAELVNSTSVLWQHLPRWDHKLKSHLSILRILYSAYIYQLCSTSCLIMEMFVWQHKLVSLSQSLNMSGPHLSPSGLLLLPPTPPIPTWQSLWWQL